MLELNKPYFILHNWFLDMNECGQSSDLCHTNASCSNIMGSYQCTCQSGFTGDGTSCSGMSGAVFRYECKSSF